MKNRSVKKSAGKPAAKEVSKPSAKPGHSVRIPVAIGDLGEFADSTINLAGTLVSKGETFITDGMKLCLVKHADELAAEGADVAFGIEHADVAGIVRLARSRKGWAGCSESLTLEVPVGRTAAVAPELAAFPGAIVPRARLVDKRPVPYQQVIEQSVSSSSSPVRLSTRNLRALVELLERCSVPEAEITLCKQARASSGFDSLMLKGDSLSPAIKSVLGICLGIQKS